MFNQLWSLHDCRGREESLHDGAVSVGIKEDADVLPGTSGTSVAVVMVDEENPQLLSTLN